MTPANPHAARRARAVRLAAAAQRHGRQTLRAPFVVSVAFALVLNGTLLSGLATSAQKWRDATHPSRQVTWVTAVAGAPAATELEPVDRAMPPRQSPSVAAQVPRHAFTPPAPKAAASATAPEALPSAHETGNEVRFYDHREVDRVAEPDSDWNLDAALLDGAGLNTLVFEVFISTSGEVVACTVLQPVDLESDMRRLLEERLRNATVRPAVRAGVAVPSVRRIELSVQSSAQ